MEQGVYEQLKSQNLKAEAKLTDLESQIEAVLESYPESDELTELRTQNAKLKYRLKILQRNVNEMEDNDKSISIIHELKKLFKVAIEASYPDFKNVPVAITATSPKQAKFGDYQCNSAMALTKQLNKTKNSGLKPSDIATLIVSNLPANSLIESKTVEPSGFINIKLNAEFVSKQLSKIILNGVNPPDVPKKKVVIDFSSPNIAKEMHVGHLRSTIIGESISRLLEFCGHEVLRLNHIGDWGTQFGMLLAQLMDTYPDYRNSTPNISDLLAIYKASKARFDSDEEFKTRAYELVVRLQNKDPEVYPLWLNICDVSRKEFNNLYDRLNVTLKERGESFYQDLMVRAVQDLNNLGALEKDELMRLIMFYKEETVPLIIVKSDGGYTYATSDMSAIRHRVDEEKADWIIYVVDAGQALHLNTVFNCARKVGWVPPTVRLDHVAFGVVLGEDKKKFKTRSGDTVRLVDLLDEGLNRSLLKLKEKNRDQELTEEELKKAQEAVAYGCIKYADLSLSRQSDYVFSFDKMLEDKGNTAVYLLYTYTRISSIARAAKVTPEQLKEAAKLPIDLSHPKEWKLGKTILKFSEIIMNVLDDLYLNTLCEFLFNLAGIYTEFYDNCYCLEKDKEGKIIKVNMNRLLLCEATALVMKAGLTILGIETVGKM